MIRAALAGCLLAALTGCAGIATYRVRPFYDQGAGRVLCCEAFITNGKDIASVNVRVAMSGDTYTIDFAETGVSASAPIDSAGAIATNVSAAVANAAAAAVKLTK